MIPNPFSFTATIASLWLSQSSLWSLSIWCTRYCITTTNNVNVHMTKIIHIFTWIRPLVKVWFLPIVRTEQLYCYHVLCTCSVWWCIYYYGSFFNQGRYLQIVFLWLELRITNNSPLDTRLNFSSVVGLSLPLYEKNPFPHNFK